jgi:hypothetical protein
MRILLIFSLFLSFHSCSSSKKTLSKVENTSKIQYPEGQLKDDVRMTDLKNKVKIISSKIEGHILFLDIEYSGICDVNEVQLYGEKRISKSLPPIRNVVLDVGEECDSKKKEKTTLAFAIRNFAYGGTKSEIILHFPQFEFDLNYIND